jgi:hypothetical protein
MHRSREGFAPYNLKRPFCPRAFLGNPIPTQVNVEAFLQGAVAREDARFEHGEDDSEGLEVTSRPSSPLTEVESVVESEEEADALTQRHPSPGLQPSTKKRRNEGAKMRRAKKRVKHATSGHQPHTYAARPSTVAYRAKELKPLKAPADAENFPAAGSGSWVGIRKGSAKRVPWTVADLVDDGFTIVEWDGR